MSKDQEPAGNCTQSKQVQVERAVRLLPEPTDTELLYWLSQQVFFPYDTPNDGVFVGVSEKYAPHGSFTGDPDKDFDQFKVAIKLAMFEQPNVHEITGWQAGEGKDNEPTN